MPTVSLLTDFGLQDEFVGVMHGVILRINPAARVVDLCHAVPPGDRQRAAYLWAWSYRYFPPRTVHVAVVDPGVGTARRILCAEAHGQYFLAPDNGMLTLVLREARRPVVYEVRASRYWLRPVSATFHGRDILAPVAAHLSRGITPRVLGPRTTMWEQLSLPPVRRQGRLWYGAVVDIDRFGNLVTNVGAEVLAQVGRPAFRVRRRRMGLVRTYQGVRRGGVAAMVGSRGLVEIAVRDGSAAQLLRACVGDRVTLAAR